jgi:sugar/nucleoside kinase (ribokinase family)
MPDVACLGILVADVIARPVDEYPGRGELSLCQSIAPYIGGCAANTGIGLQKLGVSTAVMGKVGRDGFGNFVKGVLAEQGLDVRGLTQDVNASTSATMVMVAADGERSFIHCIGANATLTEHDVNWGLIAQSKLLHVAGHFLMPAFDGEPCARVLRRAKELGVTTALDTAWDATGRWLKTLRPALPYIDYFVPSYSEARRCVEGLEDRDTPENVAKFFQDEGVGVVGLKMGEAGSYIRGGSKQEYCELRIPPFRVRAVDATGAGDAFAAGFLAGVVHGFDLETTGRLANATGACVVTQVGTIAGYRSLDETLEFMQTHNQVSKGFSKG